MATFSAKSISLDITFREFLQYLEKQNCGLASLVPEVLVRVRTVVVYSTPVLQISCKNEKFLIPVGCSDT